MRRCCAMRLARRACLFPHGAVSVRLCSLRPGYLPGRTAAPEWLAARADLGGQHAVLPAQQHPCDLHQRVRGPVGREAARPARNCSACWVHGDARIGDHGLAALCRLHPDVDGMDRYGNRRDRDRRKPVVRAPSRARHQSGLHRCEFRRGRRYALARASRRTIRLCSRDADRGSGHGCRSRARRARLDRSAISGRGRGDQRAIATSIAARNGRNIARKSDAQPGVLDDLASLCARFGRPDRLHRAPDRAA